VPSTRRLVRWVAAVVVLSFPLRAAAFNWLDFNGRIEPGVAFPSGDPQSSVFGAGGGLGIKAAWSPLPYLDAQLAVYYLAFSADPKALSTGDVGAMGAFGVGARAKWPRRMEVPIGNFYLPSWLSPWIDLEFLYVGTGGLSRGGFTFGFGAHFTPPGVKRILWFGPYLRYLQIFQGDEEGGDSFRNADAKIVMLGISIEAGVPQTLKPRDSDNDGISDPDDKCANEAEDRDSFEDDDGCPELDNDKDGVLDDKDKCPMEAGVRDNNGCPAIDADKDGIPDDKDRCPTAAGPADNQGCPRYGKITVTDQKLELSEKIFFAYDKAEILPKSYGLLDEVVQALMDQPNLRVRIEGHTDDRGSVSHNNQLSDGRAKAVRDYLVDKGVAPERIETKGYGSSLPLDTNKTPEGRERNRRVEFVIIGR